jgi:ADP-heptose:LPS heptosyltransferase
VRISLICLDNLGDLVFNSSLVGPLKEQYPEASWFILCKDYAAAIAKSFPVAATVISADPWWDSSPGRGPGTISTFLQAVARIRRVKPEITIVTSTNWRAAAVALAIGSPIRIGFEGKKSRFFLTHSVATDGWSQIPVTRQLFRLLEPLSIPQPSTEPKVKLVAQEAGQFTVPAESFVVLHPFAGALRRCWPLKGWSGLAQKLRISGYKIVWMGRADEIGQIHSTIPETATDDFMESLSRGELSNTLAITSKACLLIGHDSGPIHFAAALGVPVLGLYLPGEFPRTVSHGSAVHQVIHRASPDELELEEVWGAAQGLLKSNPI